mgnify:FL=1
MKYIALIVLTALSMLSCKKETTQADKPVATISQDSLVRSIHDKWKFTIAINNPTITKNLSNWEDWRNYVNELTITPNPSLGNMAHKTTKLVSMVAVLKNSIPEKYNKQETKARLALLETNIQSLDMLLGLEPINIKEIHKLLANIQKNTNSIINQFNEFEVKAQIPKEIGESELTQPVDTIKRATLNAIPKE